MSFAQDLAIVIEVTDFKIAFPIFIGALFEINLFRAKNMAVLGEPRLFELFTGIRERGFAMEARFCSEIIFCLAGRTEFGTKPVTARNDRMRLQIFLCSPAPSSKMLDDFTV